MPLNNLTTTPLLIKCFQFIPNPRSLVLIKELNNNTFSELRENAIYEQEKTKSLCKIRSVSKLWNYVLSSQRDCWDNCSLFIDPFFSSQRLKIEFLSSPPLSFVQLHQTDHSKQKQLLPYVVSAELNSDTLKATQTSMKDIKQLKRLEIMIYDEKVLDLTWQLCSLESLKLHLEQPYANQTTLFGIIQIQSLTHLSLSCEFALESKCFAPLTQLPSLTSLFLDTHLDDYSDLCFFTYLPILTHLQVKVIDFSHLADDLFLPRLTHLTVNCYDKLLDIGKHSKNLRGLVYKVNGEEQNPWPSLKERKWEEHLANTLHCCNHLVSFQLLVTQDEYLSGYKGKRIIVPSDDSLLNELLSSCTFADGHFRNGGKSQLINGLKQRQKDSIKIPQ